MRTTQSLVLGMALSLSGAAAHATLMSTGADGSFQPATSVVLDPTRQIFNFTDIFIPVGVTVSFGGLSSSQPVELLATGNIDIAGVLDAGTNSLLIETPGTIGLSGSLLTLGETLTLVGGAIDISAGSIINIEGYSGGIPSVIQPGAFVLLNPPRILTVPEPETLALLGLGLTAMGVGRRRVRVPPVPCAFS
jgi:hypothetical protein